MDIEMEDAPEEASVVAPPPQAPQYSPARSLPTPPSVSVVLDAPNICWSFLKAQPGQVYATFPPRLRPPVTGLHICLNFFAQYGVNAVAICPDWWNHTSNQTFWPDKEFEKSDFEAFKGLRNQGTLFCCPSGEHDDLYLVDFCFRTNGFLVSNDKFRDHKAERGLSKDFIEERRIGYMWVGQQFVPNPDHLANMQKFVLEDRGQPPVNAHLPVVPSSTTNVSPVLKVAANNSMEIQGPAPTPIHQASPRNGDLSKANETVSMETTHTSTLVYPISKSPSCPERKNTTSNFVPKTILQSIQPDTKRVIIQVPSEAVKYIIGKHGSKIQELQEVTKSHIQVLKEIADKKTEVAIGGSPEQIEQAKVLIQEIVDRIVPLYRSPSGAKP